MWQKSSVLRFKGRAAVLLAIVALCLAVSWLLPAVNRQVSDSGARPLVIIASDGASRDHSLNVWSHVDAEGNYSFSLYARVPRTPDAEYSRFQLDYQIVVISAGAEGRVTCDGGETQARATTVETLSAGPAFAYENDRRSTTNSATHTSAPTPVDAVDGGDPSQTITPSAPPSTTPVPLEHPIQAVQVEGRLWTFYDDESVRRPFLPAEDGVFVQQCSIAKELVWNSTDVNAPLTQETSTLLAPKFQRIDIDGQPDVTTTLRAFLDLQRAPGLTLTESFPSAVTNAMTWRQDYSVSSGTGVIDEAEYDYTDLPIAITSNRAGAQELQNRTLFGGFAFSISIALFLRGISDLLDAKVERHAAERAAMSDSGAPNP